MIVLSLGSGVVAYQMNREPAHPAGGAAPQLPLPQRTVVALQPIRAGQVIAAEAVGLVSVGMAPTEGFEDSDEVVGRTAATSISVGEPILRKHFDVEGVIARMLQPGERAVAVKVSGPVGLGGFARPGDLVDVLLYLKKDGREVEESQALVLLERVRMLAFGALTERGQDGKPVLDAHTAVLAVRDRDAPALLLADAAGTVRLALREPGDDAVRGGARHGAGHSVRLREVLAGRRKAGRSGESAARSSIEIIRGHSGGGTRAARR